MSEVVIPLEFVQYSDESDPLVVGKADLLPDGQLRLTAARDSHRNQLGHAVAELNAREGLHVDAPAMSSERYANGSRIVDRRGDGDYIDALQEHFRKYYHLEVEYGPEPEPEV